MQTFEYVEVNGATPRDRGMCYGHKAKEKIAQCIESYRGYFARHSTVDWEDLRRYSMDYVPMLKDKMPEILEEAQGIALGAEVPFEDIMVINCRYEITKQSHVAECTTAAVLPRAGGGAGGFLVKNWDYRVGVMDHIIILHIKGADGVNLMGLTEAGQLMREGFNNHGIGIVNNALKSIDDGPGAGIPVTFLRRRVLDCKGFEEAKEWVLSSQRSVSNNMLLMSAAGQAVDVEGSPSGCDLIHPRADIITHANHFTVRPHLENFRTSPREDRLRELLVARWGSIDIAYLKDCMADHQNFPKSICSHPADTFAFLEDRDITVAGIIIDFAARALHICAGPPCAGAFEKYTLS